VLTTLALPWVIPVTQFKVADQAALDRELRKIVAAGGEGLMLHRGSSAYRAERTGDLLKLKPYLDAEVRVVGYLRGNGKYRDMMGALQVERPDGLQFRLGTGFTDEQRRHPPPLGSWVTYSYRSLTAKGIPRFARFLRVRDDMPPH
jgi:DNA ligase-1